MPCHSQENFQFGALPAFNLSYKINSNWRVISKVESRQQFKGGSSLSDSNYQYLLTDFAAIISRRSGLQNRIAAGYLIRFRNSDVIHRSIQQFTLVSNVEAFRLAHRFSSDQTFSRNSSVEFRLRYRLTTEFPLSGENVDKNEFYLKINNEYLSAIQSGDHDLEIRLIPLLGYLFTDSNKLEMGLDYRLDGFLNDEARSRYWISVNWYLQL